MDGGGFLATNLLSPMALAFVLGAVAVGLRSDLRLPADLGSELSIYLLPAIELKRGAALRRAEITLTFRFNLAVGVPLFPALARPRA